MRRHRRTAKGAFEDRDAAQAVMEAIQDQMVGAGQQRDAANRHAKVLEEARMRTVFQASQQTIEFDQMEQEYMHQL